MASRKLKHEVVVTGANGHSVTTQKTYSIKADSDSFFMTFIEHLSTLLQVKNTTDIKVLTALNSMANFNTGRVIINTEQRKELLLSLDLDNQVFSNSIGRLKALGLIAGERGVYDINPFVFWKGTTDERRRILQERGVEVKLIFEPSNNFNQ